ncbi:MAG: prephenate dehydrogenase [Desulfurispora sp.]|uniref:prephenate dehydrogenase n=1 Tax=Desulfurispora sp. TaxID=3014275 RepID=UPI00404AFB58
MALRRQGLVGTVAGYDQDPVTCQIAKDKGAVDEILSGLPGIATADLVLLCTPVSTTLAMLPGVARYAAPRTLIIDTASTKTDIVQQAARYFPPGDDRTFIGGHPLAGSEKNGINAARPDLFQQAVFALVPPGGGSSVPAPLLQLLEALSCRPLLLEAAEHDRAVALISHLPHLVASCLAGTARAGGEQELLHSLAAGGWRDTTRVARGRCDLWVDILLSNADYLLPAIDLLQQHLTRLKEMLDQRKKESLQVYLDEARQFLMEYDTKTIEPATGLSR